MTKTEAQALREAASAAVRRYSRMSRSAMRVENVAAQEAAGMQHLFGGPVSKDELIADTLELRGYGIARLNEATHIVAHDVVWPDCRWCQMEIRECCVGVECHCDMPALPDDPPEVDPEDAEAQRIAETYADAADEYRAIEAGEL